MPKATFDKSRLLELHARIGQTGVPIILTFINKDGTARAIDEEDFLLRVKKRPSSPTAMFDLEIGSGLTVIGAELNKLKIELSEENSNQDPDTNFYTLLSVEENHTWLNGPFKFHNGEYDGVEITDEITISENGVDVTISITSGNGASVEAASQAEVNAGIVGDKYVSPETLANWSGDNTVQPATQSEVNTGTATGVYVSPSTLQDKDDTAVALVDGATIDITGPKHTLSTATGRTFTISHAGDDIVLVITLSATSATFTFPASTLCCADGLSSGDNTLQIVGAASGDKHFVSIIKFGSSYFVSSLNMKK